jgi:hypothetical protein
MKNFLQKKNPQILFAKLVAIYFITQLIFRS